ncbi:secreted RxLR effector protein 161-like [Lycium ferocissimum]|uniref:secreted RxLR effector protein 161-like n=1 Tax=Lycium ferocissimum TaxID=112874 RepID=UPI0028169C8D|nr:secreted RxLR effector protein 161-like [Lycium ferocissimum]
MHLANAIRPDIAFSVNLLARYSSYPTQRHWNGVKHILRYLKGTSDMGLFYVNNGSTDLVGYADVGYLSDPHKARSQQAICLHAEVLLYHGDPQSIPLLLLLRIIFEIIAIHEASRECVWLRLVIHFIRERCGLKCDTKIPTVLYEDNVACIP